MREVRFRLSASKNFTRREENVSDSRVFGPLRLSRRFRMFFFSFLFSSLSYSLSSLSISMMMMIVVARTTRKIFALGGHPPDRVVDIDYVRVRSSKRRNRERERVIGRVSCRFLVEKKKLFSLSRLKMFDFFDVSNARERERGASFFEIRRKKEGPNS